MKIVLIGGVGLIGLKTAKPNRGHEVPAASPKTGVNTISGEGLPDALAGAEIVVDLANAPSWKDKAVLEFFETSGHNLLATEAKAGVKHNIALSIVGTERLPENGYFRAKLVQEKLIKASPIPHTIVHSIQFFEFLKGTPDEGTVGTVAFQPIASDDVVGYRARKATQRHDRSLWSRALSRERDRCPVSGRDQRSADALFRDRAQRSAACIRQGCMAESQIPDSVPYPGDGARFGKIAFKDWS